MCLKKVIEYNPKQKKGTGYKVFESRGSKLRFPFRGYWKSMTIGVWLEADKFAMPTKITPTSNQKPYTSGFHLFKRKATAFKYARTVPHPMRTRVFRVKYTNACAKGMTFGWVTVVAKNMKVLEEVKP